jgi:arginase family enzyme
MTRRPTSPWRVPAVQPVTAESRVESTFRSGPCGWTMSKMPGCRFARAALRKGGPSRRYKLRWPGGPSPFPSLA